MLQNMFLGSQHILSMRDILLQNIHGENVLQAAVVNVSGLDLYNRFYWNFNHIIDVPTI